jgi:hypothetical protein
MFQRFARTTAMVVCHRDAIVERTCRHVTALKPLRWHHSCTTGYFNALLLLNTYIKRVVYAKIFFEASKGHANAER